MVFRHLLQKKLYFTAVLIIALWFNMISVTSVVAATRTRYVAPAGVDGGNCDSTTTPCRTIQYAINRSSSGDKILVAQGTYTYSPASDPCSFLVTRAVICFVDKRLTILGGYSTTNWSVATPSENLTTIDGQNTYRGVAVVGYNTTTTYLDMQGFTIQNGRAHGPTYTSSNSPYGIGGGMLVVHASTTLKDVTFRNNRVIGANTSGDGGSADGAALRIEASPVGTSSLLQRVIFDNNQSYGGTGSVRGGVAFGALFIYASTATIEDAIFTNNLAQAGSSTGSGTSTKDGLNADALGGAIGAASSAITLRRVTMTGNQARGGDASTTGGGAYGAGIYVEGVYPATASLTLSDAHLADNTATAGSAATGGNAAGGGIFIQNSHAYIERVNVITNSVIGGSSTGGGRAGIPAGGGIYLGANRQGMPRAILINLIAAENLVTHGNGVPLGGGGGSIVVQGVDADITHATIARNRLASTLVLGQGLNVLPWPSQSGGSLPAAVNLNYSIIAEHTEGGKLAAAVVVERGSTLTFNRGLFAGNTKDTNADDVPVTAGSINGLSTMLSASSAGFLSPGSPSHNYHVRLDSPAKNQAMGSTTTSDIESQSRPYSNVTDIGADEHHPFPLLVIPGDRALRVDWTVGSSVLEGGVQRYQVLVTCSPGANPPDQMNCGSPFDVGNATTLWLSGLSNFKDYTMFVKAYDFSGVLVAESKAVTTYPTDIFVYLPSVVR